jgi:hypothetical protein
MRVQVLYLPSTDDTQPFALIFDRVTTEEAQAMATPQGRSQLENFQRNVGAVAVAVFDTEVDVP